MRTCCGKKRLFHYIAVFLFLIYSGLSVSIEFLHNHHYPAGDSVVLTARVDSGRSVAGSYEGADSEIDGILQPVEYGMHKGLCLACMWLSNTRSLFQIVALPPVSYVVLPVAGDFIAGLVSDTPHNFNSRAPPSSA